MMKSKSKSRWGNKFGIFLLPVYYHKSGADPIQYLKRAKVMLDQKKQSLEAHFSYIIGDFVMSFLGAKVKIKLSKMELELNHEISALLLCICY